MPQRVSESKPNGFTMQCRNCKNTIYLQSGQGGRWRAYEPNYDATEMDQWNRHRCPDALQDAEIMNLIAPPGSKPADLIPRIYRLIEDLQSFIEQAESRRE
jgi:hypothetical protein